MENRKTILIVEDDKYIIHFLSISLKEEDYGLWVAKTVKEAVSLFYANRPDLVILDLVLPDGGGMEVIESIREIAEECCVSEAKVKTSLFRTRERLRTELEQERIRL